MSGRRPGVVGVRAVRGLARRPDLWVTAVRTGVRMGGPGWWRRWPPGVGAPAAYEAFRRQTMYGSDGDATMDAAELVAYLEWCRRMQALR